MEAYDATLLGMLQQEGQIAKFLDVVMGFLFRRTDFYHVMKSRDDKIGFPPGVAPRLLIQAYEAYETLAKKRNDKKDTRTIIPSRPDQKEIKNKMAAEVLGSNTESQQQASGEKLVETKNTKAPSQNPLSPDSQKEFQDNPESHNGAIRDGYRWAQTLTDCDLRIQVPSTILKAKQVSVCIKRKHILASYLDDKHQANTLVDSDLSWDVNVEESMWSLVPAECIHINLEKVQERWWEQVFINEPKINTQKIEASVPMEDLDDGAQSVVNQLMYDEKQKNLGLPTSKEQKVQETLRKAWDSEGSPFRGTPYDPSLVNTSGNT